MNKVSDGYVYIKTKKGMHGLKQATILAYGNLVKNLQPYRYIPIHYTMGLWKGETKQTTFCLCVDDFGIKYFNKSDVNHLLQSLQKNHIVTVDCSWKNSVVSLSIGNTTMNMLTCQCQVMYKK